MRTLLIRFSSLGDVVLATAAVEALRAELPDARVDVLTKPAHRGVFTGNPGVTELLDWAPEEGLLGLARRVRAGGYDWIVDLHANLRTRLLRAAVRGPRWSVYRKGAMRRRLAVRLRRPLLLAGQPHVVERYLRALTPLGVSGIRRLPKLYIEEAGREAVKRKMDTAGWSADRPTIGLAPGARWATKAWPREHWVALARELGARGRHQLVMIGGTGESDLCRDILEVAGAEGVNLAGKTSIQETAAVLERCQVLVSNDSAPMHLATAVGTRVVALFGPTVAGFGFPPLGRDDVVLEESLVCRPCSLHGDDRCPEGHHRCLEDLAPDSVLEALQRAPGGTR